jgi:polyhydroxyalkanoate synthesis regulator phasin
MILDSRDITNQKTSETVLAELVATGTLGREDAAEFVKKLQRVLNEQTDVLVDRVLVALK